MQVTDELWRLERVVLHECQWFGVLFQNAQAFRSDKKNNQSVSRICGSRAIRVSS